MVRVDFGVAGGLFNGAIAELEDVARLQDFVRTVVVVACC